VWGDPPQANRDRVGAGQLSNSHRVWFSSLAIPSVFATRSLTVAVRLET
jgi:hypothetical protein